MKRFPSIAIAAVLAASLNAQCVNTILTGGNGQNGTMFDVVNLTGSAVTVFGFEQSWFNAGTSTVEIYTKSGTYFGSENIAGAWTLVGTSTGVAHPTTNVLVPIPAVLSVVIGGGATQGFYITGNAVADTVAYTTGVNQLGTVIGTDGVIEVRAGVGKAYPFAGTFGLPTAGRLWNGRVCHGTAPSPTYQTNSPQASFNFEGVTTAGFSPAVVNRCNGAVISANFASSTLAGNGYEIVISLAPLVPAGGGAITTGNGQIVNINFADPSTSFLFGLTFPPFPAPAFTIPVVIPGVPTICAQVAILDGGHPDGFRLSQAMQLNNTGGTASTIIPGPVGDDVAQSFTAGTTYTDGGCGIFVAPALPLYGVLRTNYHVITNGRITWPNADTGFTATVAGAQTGQGMTGAWTDLNTVVGGNITVGMVGTAFVANWSSVGYFAQPGTASTFSISIDSVSGVITLSGLNTIGTPTAVMNMFLGASPGAGATNPGAAAFSGAGAGAAGASTDMIYTFGGAGPALAGGATTVVLTPDGANNYTWTSF